MPRADSHASATGFEAMPVLENARQELLCQYQSRGMSQIEAYEKAGYKPDRAHAAALAAKSIISQRVRELLQRNVTARDEQVAMSVAQGLEELEAARAGAMEAGRFNDAIAATVAKLKAAGLWIEKSERTSVR